MDLYGPAQPDHFADYEDGWRLHVHLAARDLFQRRLAHTFASGGRKLEKRDWIAGRPPTVDQTGRDRCPIIKKRSTAVFSVVRD